MINPNNLHEILALDDSDFVRAAYQLYLRRTPDPEGYQHYLYRLRIGTPKLQLLGQIRFSGEGRAQGVDAKTLEAAIKKQKLASMPFIGRLIRPFLKGVQRYEVEYQLRAVANHLGALQAANGRTLEAVRGELKALNFPTAFTQVGSESSTRSDEAASGTHTVTSQPTAQIGASSALLDSVAPTARQPLRRLSLRRFSLGTQP